MKKNRLVIGFDSWTGGLKNYDYLYPAFKESQFEFQLYHIERWAPNMDEARPNNNSKIGMPVFDISDYSRSDLLDFILRLNPVAVVFLSVDSLTHRAINRVLRFHNIPTLHLYHGVISVQDISMSSDRSMSPLARIRFIRARIPRIFFKVIPTYLLALRKSNANFSAYFGFFGELLKDAFGKYRAVAACDSKCSHCAIYVESDKKHASGKYRYAPNQISVVGNPDIVKFGLRVEDINSVAREAEGLNDELIYIDTGMYLTGRVYSSHLDYVKHLEFTKKKLESQGLRLCVKLKPAAMKSSIATLLKGKGFDIIENESFLERLKGSAGVLVEPTTASLIPALLGLPVFFVKYGRLVNQKYGPAMMSYPRGELLTDLDDVRNKLSRLREDSDERSLIEWAASNSGPLPAETMPARVVECLETLVKVRTS